ncbi:MULTISPECIES: hypothetical protein [unclassified Streptomyces]|uniref:hypothetical protein n=1 Tax=unclassified Streptomyces TaxID=2593676 RepID=UPI001908C1BA|nr:hypothetical protein [Streptomyces sp. HSG2]
MGIWDRFRRRRAGSEAGDAADSTTRPGARPGDDDLEQRVDPARRPPDDRFRVPRGEHLRESGSDD